MTAVDVGSMRFGVVVLPEHEWKVAEQRWRTADHLGFHHAWTYDHLMWRWFADRRWYGAIPTLTAAATVTDTIGLGLLVATPNFRHPAALAKDLVTVDDVADGRLICGLGAGAPGHDASLLGQPPLDPRTRADRFTAFVDLLDRLLVHGDVDESSDWYTTANATFHPRAGQGERLPFAVAAAGPKGMDLAARFGRHWVTSGPPNDFDPKPLREVMPVLKRQQATVDAACERVDRDPGSLRRLLLADAAVGGVTSSVAAYEDAAGELADAGFTDLVVHWPRPDQPYQGDEQVVVDFAEKHLVGVACA
ncbi:LLM class flavin-dependent oxidoreductase [Actinokineospora cianjurensis]|uniref:Alkanesulfonate monooxygenase SsuD/methylene tetrahydromethanopterin reductase-like flavin-dependent oxidoreductase (Luciferase family) n=1 Tax=Actinokineospora cianjurensis TaxID=585224 RepID=A0A421B1F5_9PSEU|nr:LLM class flavin-dependent oxidoreductase [Actinokineospora cianjurensis]RLK58182.1 alkanesulfonate monooxygenase SsuD/methylene tetrahydromethanopterin reductase-like flavin-dependent oxidoreductase (luciferase family) [Actinokineospora cianjurensis]